MATPCSSWITHEVSLVSIDRVSDSYQYKVSLTLGTLKRRAGSTLTPDPSETRQLPIVFLCVLRSNDYNWTIVQHAAGRGALSWSLQFIVIIWLSLVLHFFFSVFFFLFYLLRFCSDMVIGNSSLRSCPLEAGEAVLITDSGGFGDRIIYTLYVYIIYT